MTRTGSIRLSDAFGQIWEMSRDDGLSVFTGDTFEFRSAAGALKLGTVRRAATGSRSSIEITQVVTSDGRSLAAGGIPLSEARLVVTETEQSATGGASDISNPLVSVTLGNKVSSSGSRQNSSEGSPICLEVETSNGSGCTITVDQAGNLLVTVNGKMRIQCDDIELGTGTARSLIDERLVSLFNKHVHSSPGSVPATPILSSQVSTSETKAS